MAGIGPERADGGAMAGRWRPRCQVTDDITALMVQHCKVVSLSQELRAVKAHEPGAEAESRSPTDPGHWFS